MEFPFVFDYYDEKSDAYFEALNSMKTETDSPENSALKTSHNKPLISP